MSWSLHGGRWPVYRLNPAAVMKAACTPPLTFHGSACMRVAHLSAGYCINRMHEHTMHIHTNSAAAPGPHYTLPPQQWQPSKHQPQAQQSSGGLPRGGPGTGGSSVLGNWGAGGPTTPSRLARCVPNPQSISKAFMPNMCCMHTHHPYDQHHLIPKSPPIPMSHTHVFSFLHAHHTITPVRITPTSHLSLALCAQHALLCRCMLPNHTFLISFPEFSCQPLPHFVTLSHTLSHFVVTGPPPTRPLSPPPWKQRRKAVQQHCSPRPRPAAPPCPRCRREMPCLPACRLQCAARGREARGMWGAHHLHLAHRGWTPRHPGERPRLQCSPFYGCFMYFHLFVCPGVPFCMLGFDVCCVFVCVCSLWLLVCAGGHFQH